MTQFQSPTDVGPVHRAGVPWSASAISSFVLSLVGCLGVTALLGLVFGIVGLRQTRDGVRRGRGFAVAAIPISLFSLLISAGLAVVLAGVAYTAALSAQIPMMFMGSSANKADAVTILRDLASSEFNESVDTDRLMHWFGEVRTTYGDLVQIEPATAVRGPSGTSELSFKTKFVNGTVDIRVAVRFDGFKVRMHTISVGGLSPRDTEQ